MDADTGGTGWLAGAVAVAAAFAAGVSAWLSRKALERAHWPYVWPEYRLEPIDDQGTGEDASRLAVRLHNDGTGLALDVVWSVAHHASARRKPGPDREVRAPSWIGELITQANREPGARALRSGEVVPEGSDEWMREKVGINYQNSGPRSHSIVVRYSDVAGRRWEYHERLFSARELATAPRRVRRRLYRVEEEGERRRLRFGWDW